MRDLRESCRIAVVQAAPVMFDKAACTVKAVELIRAAAAERAELIAFPELFIWCLGRRQRSWAGPPGRLGPT